MIVLDSSAAIEALRDADDGRAIRQVLSGDELVISCELLRAEVASVLRKFAQTGNLSAHEANQHLSDAMALVNIFCPLEYLQAEALAESIRLDHSIYDMCYFVLARRTRATLFTADKTLLKLSEENGVECMTFTNW